MDNPKNPFFSLSPCELTLLATAVALMLVEGLDTSERSVVSNFLGAVAQNIEIFGAQESNLIK